ncbi:hypothetical protein F2Q69_00021325 [Brassica cretica]|uniref:Uncharacterized protein n=1 Tax=Brassica cretica TaxID=69181 RepID=A0A8S9QIN6_BRACR|nr:hypothetical protein F2Q69_00021325 [Brassica cretica]
MSKRTGSSIPLTVEKVKSKRRMDSPISKSDSSSDPHDETEHNLLAPAPLSYTPLIPPLVGPASLVGEDDFAEWRKKYLLPPYAVLRASSSSERAYNCMPEEITVYEAFFDSGFRGEVPSIIAELCDYFRISPSQLNPLAWRILIAIQNLEDVKCLPLGVNKVLYAYHLAPISGGEVHFHLRPCSGLPIVEELSKNDPGTHHALSEGESNVLRTRTLPLERRQVVYFLSSKVLQRTRLWGGDKGGVGEKGSVSKDTSDDDMTITESRLKTVVKVEPTSSSQGKNSKDGVVTRSARQSSRHWALFWWAIHCSLQLELQSISSG